MKNWHIGLLVAAGVFLIDQAAKYYVTGPLGLDVQDASLTVLPIFDLRFVKNVGVSLGLLPASGATMRWRPGSPRPMVTPMDVSHSSKCSRMPTDSLPRWTLTRMAKSILTRSATTKPWLRPR